MNQEFMSNADISKQPSAGTVKRKAVLGRDSLNMPNLITGTRLLLSLVLFSMISAGGWWISAAALFVFAASTDALDGYLARRYKQITVLGRILDPFVDKVIVCGSFVFLLEKQGASDSGVNAWMVIIIIGREMFVSSLRGILEKEGKDFSASIAGKLKMTLQCVAVTVSLLSLSTSLNWPWLPWFRDVMLWGAVGVTVWSGLIYVIRGFSLLRQE
jgi:CDP-diacylglycerol--glycerol-3-phosphate 3-phosphatidyltransferase